MVIAWLVAGACAVVGAAGWWRSARLRGELDGARVRLGELDDRLGRTRELEGRLSQALDAIQLGVVLAGPDGEVIFRNAAAVAFSAARHGDALVEAAVDELLARALGGEEGEREVEVFGPPLRSHIVRCFPLWGRDRELGGVIGALVLVEENTERRRLDQVRRDFVANISHELRTPVGALGLLAETIEDEPDPETVRRLAGRMVSEADRVADTIDDLLELSRIEFGDETHIDELDLGSLVAEAASRIAAAAELRTVSLHLPAPPAIEVRGDRRQIVSALYNLIDNAVKFSPVGGSVEVEVGPVADGVRVSVTDHGPGIPERDIDRIFERFYRVDRARSRETGGTGLGLAIVRHVAANHGGEVTVTSREGEGSTFALRLPTDGSGAERTIERMGAER